MRKISSALFLTIFLAGFSSCQKEISQESVAQIQTVDVTLTASSEDGVKVSLGSNLCPQWEDNDSLAVFDGTICSPFIVSKNSGTSAEFGGRVSKGANAISAVFPFSAASGTDKDVVTIEFPETQYVTPGDSCCSSALICVATTDMTAKHLSFQNIYALLKIDIDINGVETVKVSGKKGEILSGKGTVDLSSSLAFNATEGRQYVYLRSSEGSFKQGSYYLAIPAVNFTEGFSIEMMRNDGATAVKSTENSLTVQRNHGADLSSITFETKWKVSIASAEQLLAWNNAAASRTDFDEVELKADIDLGGIEWTPNDLRGTFEGNSHKIYNFTVTDKQYSGFFNVVYGTVRNLVVGSSDYNGVTGTWDGKTVIKNSSTEYSGWNYLGSFASRLGANSTLSGCVNFAKVEVSSQFNKKAKIGGIAGAIVGENSSILNCINYGEVVNNASTSTATSSGNFDTVGGITANCEDAAGIVIEGCSNYGRICSNNKYIEYIGGIIGVTNGQVASGADPKDNVILIKNCTNYGEVVLGETIYDSSRIRYVAGIAGCLCSAKLEGCVNLGNITSNQHDKLYIGGIAAYFVKSVGSEIKNCVNGESGSAATKAILTTNDNYSYIGGILAGIDSKASGQLDITGCKNYADITTTNGYVYHIGGFGGNWAASACVVNVSDCENFGAVSNTSTVAKTENKVGGFVGYMTNTAGNRSTFTNCTNHGNVTTTKMLNASAQIGGFCATTNYTDFTGCSNEGNITFSNAISTAHGNAMNVGGIVGYGSNDVNFANCTNSGTIKIGSSVCTGSGLAGGIVGNNKGGNIINCENSGTVCVDGDYKGAASVGGIIGILSNKIIIDSSTNKGTVYAKKTSGNFLVGGIMGDGGSLAAEIKNCVNEGVVYAEQTAYARQYFTVGGIVGRSKGASGALHEIKNCTNKGTVTVTANTDNQLCNAGGIVGETNTWSTVTGCTNEASGKVTCVNNVAAAKTTKTAYAGGISGGDNESTVGSAGNDTVTGNANYADVSATVEYGATAIGAGGVFGMLQRTGSFSGNSVLGSVQITATGGSTTGGAGAVMGYLAAPNYISGVTSTVSKSVLVNGASYDSVKDMEAKLSAWLLPANNGNVTATFIDAQ